MGGHFFQEVVGRLVLILSLCDGGGVEINFCLMRGRYDLVLGHISPISQPEVLRQSLLTHLILHFHVSYSHRRNATVSLLSKPFIHFLKKWVPYN